MIRAIFSKKRLPLYLVYLSIIYFLNFLFYNDLKFFLFLIYSIRGVLGVVVMVIAINTYKVSHNTLFTFLAVSLGLSSIIDSLSVAITYHHHLSHLLNEHLYLRIFSDFFNIFSLILCSKSYKKNLNLRSVFIFYYAISSIFVTLSVLLLFMLKALPPIDSVVLLNLNIKDILNLILSILSIYPVYTYFQIKDDIKDSSLENIFLLSIFYTIATICFVIASLTDFYDIFRFIANILLLFHLFFVYRIIIEAVLRKPYQTLFYDLDKNSKETQKIKDYYETVIESLPLAIMVINSNNKISFTNSTILDFLNYESKSDIYDMNLYDILDDNSICEFDDNIYNKIEFFESTFKKSNNDVFYAKVRPINVIFNDEDCTMLIIKDISSKKKIQELSHTLEQKIEEESMKTEFLSNVSHELRTPINVIYSVLQLEDIYRENNDIKSIVRHNKTLKQNCLRLLRICNNLIDSTKIESGYFVPNMKYVNIVSLIENIVSSVSSYTAIKNIDIIFDTENEEIYSICDSDLIERIILNLVSNSMKYGSDNGNIWINICNQGDYVKIVFMDDGPGIEKEKCGNIFKRFVQVDTSFSKVSQGSGVGLSLVKSLVDIHSGTIEIESDTGMGCKFTILFPTVECNVDEIAATSDFFVNDNSIVDKINIEFSDIYF